MRVAITIILALCASAIAQTTRPNVLLITADDMNYDTPRYAGGKVADITPNLDKLAGEGIYFQKAHVTVAVCQPSRSVLMTGRYPHRNGAEGFNPIRGDVPTLGEQLRAAGYYNGIFAKVPHLAPIPRFCWDTIVGAEDLGVGRDSTLYYQHAKDFFATAKKEGKPFFLMANSQDPHRPFAGSDAENERKATAEDEEGVRPRRTARAARAANADPAIAARVRMVQYRVPEELYDLVNDPGALHDLIDDPKQAERAHAMRLALLRWMEKTGDRELEHYRSRVGDLH